MRGGGSAKLPNADLFIWGGGEGHFVGMPMVADGGGGGGKNRENLPTS